MIRIIATIIFALSAQLLLAQTQLFELQPGIKSITTIQVRGNSTQQDSTIKKTLRYDEKGRLVEIDYQRYQVQYEYTTDSTVVFTSTNIPTCSQFYKITRKAGQIEIRTEKVPGSSGCSFPPEPMIFGSLNLDKLFQDVPKSLPKRGQEYEAEVRKFGEQEGEYMDLSYFRRGSQLKLASIVQREKIGEEWFVQRVLFPSYGDKIILEQQHLLDQEGEPVAQLKITELVSEIGPERQSDYEYEMDAAGNWIAQKPKQRNPQRPQYLIREIEYWD